MATTRGLVVLLVALVAQSGNGYETGQQYVYEYKAEMRFENPEQPFQVSEAAFKSVIVGVKEADAIVITMKDFETDVVNTQYRQEGHMHGHTYTKNEMAEKELNKPFKVNIPDYNAFEFSKDDPVWSVNMKKGVLSLFNINLKPGEKMSKLMEDSVMGKIETFYSIESKPHFTRPDMKVLNVTKMRNFENIESIGTSVYGFIHGKKCIKCEALQNRPMTGSSKIVYKIRSEDVTLKKGVIEEIHSYSEMIRSPFTEKGKMTRLFIHATIKLIGEEAATPLAIQGETVKHTTLQMEDANDPKKFNADIDLKKENDHVHHWTMITDMNRLKEMFKMLSEVKLDEMSPEDDDSKDPPTVFSMLMMEMGKLNYDAIETVYKDVVLAESDAAKKNTLTHLFVDTLTATGTNAAILFSMDKFKSGEFPADSIAHFLKHVPLTLLTPSKKLFDEFYTFCKDEKIKGMPNCPVGKCLLAYTSMISETCGLSEFHPKMGLPDCQNMKKEVFQQVMKPYNEVMLQEDHYQLNAIKMASNLGTPLAADYLTNFVRDNKQTNRRRVYALWGLMSVAPMAKLWSPEARKAVAEVYFNTDEPSDVRISAFVVIFHSNPPLFLLSRIVTGLYHEPSDSVRSYIASFIYNAADSKYPCDREIALKCRTLLHHLKKNRKVLPPKVHTLNSHVHISTSYDENYNYGGYAYTGLIRSPNGYLPRTLSAGFGSYVGGLRFDLFNLKYEGWGLEKILDMFASPRSMGLKQGANLWNYFGRQRRVRSAEEVKAIDEKIGVKPRDYEDVYARLSMSIFGHNVDLMTFNESAFGAMMQPENSIGSEVTKKLNQAKDKRHFFNAKTLVFQIPTEIGLSAYSATYHPGLFFHKRNSPDIKADTSTDINLKLDSHLRYESHLIHMFGVGFTPGRVDIGVGYNRHVRINRPIKASIALNLKTKKFQLKQDITGEKKLFHYEFKPFTYKIDYDFKNPEMLPMYRDSELHKFKHRVLDDKIGFGLSVEGHRLPNEVIMDDVVQFWAKMDLRQKLYFFLLNPKWHPRQIDLKMVPAEKDPATERQLEISYKHFTPESADKPSALGAESFGKAEKPDMHVHVLNIDTTFKGETERKASAELRYAFDRSLYEHIIKLMYQRTPMGSTDSKGRSLCLAMDYTFSKPEWSKNWTSLHLNDYIDTTLEIAHNNDPKVCTGGTTIKAQGKYQHSPKQLKDIECALKNWNTSDPAGSRWHNYYKKLYRMCKKNEEKAGPRNMYCTKFTMMTSQLNTFIMDMEVNDPKLMKQPWFTTIAARLWGRYALPYLVKLDVLDKNEPTKYHMNRTVRELGWNDWVIDLEQRTPDVSDKYIGIPVPALAHLAPRTTPFFFYSNLVTYNKHHYHPGCVISKNWAYTFDRQEYELPATDCYKVIAKDCSIHNLFTVLAKKDGDKKSVKIFLDKEHVIEMKPSATGVTATYNGEPQEKMFSPKTEKAGELFTLYMKGDFAYLHSYIYGIYVTLFEDSVTIQAAPFYRGKLCGLCGNYNMDGQYEFRDPQGCLQHTDYAFGRTYVVPDGTCSVPGPRAEAIDGKPNCDFNPEKVL